jgi:hypothetical protein
MHTAARVSYGTVDLHAAQNPIEKAKQFFKAQIPTVAELGNHACQTGLILHLLSPPIEPPSFPSKPGTRCAELNADPEQFSLVGIETCQTFQVKHSVITSYFLPAV